MVETIVVTQTITVNKNPHDNYYPGPSIAICLFIFVKVVSSAKK